MHEGLELVKSVKKSATQLHDCMEHVSVRVLNLGNNYKLVLKVRLHMTDTIKLTLFCKAEYYRISLSSTLYF